VSLGALLTDTQYIFCRRIQTDDQQVLVKKNDAGAERVNNCASVFV
jgi:hypothetical protein